MDAQRSKSSELGPREYQVLRTLLLFTAAMFIGPVLCFFFCKAYIFEGIFGYKNGAVGGAVSAILLAHVIIGCYIWLAIVEEKKTEPQLKGE